MGQGAESCGGYEIDYDPCYEELRSNSEPCWTMKDGSSMPISRMTKTHLRGAIRVAERSSLSQSFSCDSETFDEWVDILTSELDSRGYNSKKPTIQKSVIDNIKSKFPARGAKQQMKCHCGNEYAARKADLKRGWAKSCSKSCAATRREYGRPAATKVKDQL